MPLTSAPIFRTPLKSDYSLATINAVDSGGAAGSIVLFAANGSTLVTWALAYPCASIDEAGRAIFSIPIPVVPAALSGVASYAEIRDSTGAWAVSLPAVTGTQATPGLVALNTTQIIAGADVTLTALTLG